MDGETWNELDRTAKESYYDGMLEGFNTVIIFLYSEAEPKIDLDLLAIQLEREGELLTKEDIDVDHFINDLDEYFKENPDNNYFDLIIEKELYIPEY